MMGGFRLVHAVALSACLLLGTALASDPLPADYDEAMQLFLAHDFTDALAQCERVEIEGVKAYSNYSLRDIEVDSLTDAERAFLAQYRLPSGGTVSLYQCVDYAFRQACDEAEEFSRNGVEVMLVGHDTTLTMDGVKEFAALSPEVRLKQACRVVNPATGHFFEGYSNPEWHPFGVYIGKETGKDAIRYLPLPEMDSKIPGSHFQSEMFPHQAWKIIVFGETPGRVLIEQTRLHVLEPSAEYPAQPTVYMYPERPAEPAPITETPQELLDCDYSDVMDEFPINAYGAEPLPGQPLKDAYYTGRTYFDLNLPSGHELTDGERDLLGQRQMPTGRPINLFMLLITLKMLDVKYGRPPAGVAELHPELLDSEGLAEFKALTPAEQFEKYGDAVNPITGKFYTTFSDPEWSPGGIYFQVVEKHEDVVNTYHELYGKEELHDRNPPWEDSQLEGVRINIITVFGEEPGTVLFKRYEWGS